MEGLVDRLKRRIAIDESGCWNWQGSLVSGGYAQVYIGGERRHGQVHRVMYEATVGPIPEGMTLDHLCRNRRCVNPAHVEPVTNRENVLRGIVPSANREICKNGEHDITGADAIYLDSEGTERCRECRLESKRRYRERRRLAAA